jgi:hypothetical protein
VSKGHGATQRQILTWLGSQPREHSTIVPPRNDDGSWPEIALAFPAWERITTVACEIFGHEPTRAETETVRRSVKRLAADGLAETAICGGRYERRRTVRKPKWWDDKPRGQWDGSDPRWVGDLGGPITVEFGRVLCVRPLLTDAERAAELEEREADERRYQEVLAAFRAGSW